VRQFAGGRDDQAERLSRPGQRQQVRRDREAERYGLARARPRADQQIAVVRIGLQHGFLHRRGRFVPASSESLRERLGRAQLRE